MQGVKNRKEKIYMVWAVGERESRRSRMFQEGPEN